MSPRAVRIAPVDAPYSAEVERNFATLMPAGMEPLGIFRTLAHNPRLLTRFRRGSLLDPGSITLRERELVILRTTARCGAEYEWGVHARYFAAAAGFGERELSATVHGDESAPVWSANEQLLVRLCDELHSSARVSDDTWQALSAHYDAAQLSELLVLAGLYHAVSFFVNGAQLALEPQALKFPPKT